MISNWKYCLSFWAIDEMTRQPLYNDHCSFTRTRSIERGWLGSGETGKRVSSPRRQISILGERDLTLTRGLEGIGGRRVWASCLDLIKYQHLLLILYLNSNSIFPTAGERPWKEPWPRSSWQERAGRWDRGVERGRQVRPADQVHLNRPLKWYLEPLTGLRLGISGVVCVHLDIPDRSWWKPLLIWVLIFQGSLRPKSTTGVNSSVYWWPVGKVKDSSRNT